MTMLSCLEEGRLRAYLDGELAGAEQETAARHLAACEACAGRLETLRKTAATVGGRLERWRPDGANAAVEPDARAALARFESGLRAADRARVAGEAARRERPRFAPGAWLAGSRLRPAAATLAVALVAALLFSLSPVQSLANHLFTTFRVQQFAAVTVPVPGMSGVPDPSTVSDADKAQLVTMLSALGRLETAATPQNVREVATLDEARAHYRQYGGTLRTLPNDRLPAGFAADQARYAVSDPIAASYTLNVAVAKQYSGMIGSPELAGLWPDVPELTFKLDVPAAVATFYGDESRGFGIAQLASPTLKIPSELDIVALRAALLAMPGLPAETVAQIKAIKDEDLERTLIIPVPQDATSKNVKVNGDAGILIVDGQGRGSLVIWESNGVLYAVGGTLTEAEVLAVASNLK